MMSSFSAIMTADEILSQPFPTFEGGFTPWEYGQGTAFAFPQHDDHVVCTKPLHELVLSNLSTPEPVTPNSTGSGLDDRNRMTSNSNSGSGDLNRGVSMIDERKRRRMMSNRESARRSRMRKQKHLENLRNLVNRLRTGNRELLDRLHFVTHQCQLVRKDNDRLRSDSVILRQKLWDIHQVLLVRQLQQQLSSSTAWPCNTAVSSIN